MCCCWALLLLGSWGLKGSSESCWWIWCSCCRDRFLASSRSAQTYSRWSISIGYGRGKLFQDFDFCWTNARQCVEFGWRLEITKWETRDPWKRWRAAIRSRWSWVWDTSASSCSWMHSQRCVEFCSNANLEFSLFSYRGRQSLPKALRRCGWWIC